MTESHDELRERIVSAGVAYIKARQTLDAAYDAAQKVIAELPETKAMTDAALAHQDAADAVVAADAAAQQMPIAEGFELVDRIADEAGMPRNTFEEKYAALTPEEKKRYNDEVAALGDAALTA